MTTPKINPIVQGLTIGETHTQFWVTHNKPVHIAFNYDGTTTSIYINGERITATP